MVVQLQIYSNHFGHGKYDVNKFGILVFLMKHETLGHGRSYEQNVLFHFL